MHLTYSLRGYSFILRQNISMIKRAKENYYRNRFNVDEDDIKMTWSTIL